jgi:hypothetical protein
MSSLSPLIKALSSTGQRIIIEHDDDEGTVNNSRSTASTDDESNLTLDANKDYASEVHRLSDLISKHCSNTPRSNIEVVLFDEKEIELDDYELELENNFDDQVRLSPEDEVKEIEMLRNAAKNTKDLKSPCHSKLCRSVNEFGNKLTEHETILIGTIFERIGKIVHDENPNSETAWTTSKSITSAVKELKLLIAHLDNEVLKGVKLRNIFNND